MTFLTGYAAHGFVSRLGANRMKTMAVRAYRGPKVSLTYHLRMNTLTYGLLLIRVTFSAGRRYCDRMLPVAVELPDRVRLSRIPDMTVGAVVFAVHGCAQEGWIDRQRQRFPISLLHTDVLTVTGKTILIVTA